MRETIEQTMKTLKLGGLAHQWRNVEYTNTEQYVRELLSIEVKEREAKRTNRLVKQAGFRVLKTLDTFTWKDAIEIPPSITREEIENAAFVKEKENLVLMGAVGTGKTHLATAIALKFCQEGKNAHFFTATHLANILLEKNHKGFLNSFLRACLKTRAMADNE